MAFESTNVSWFKHKIGFFSMPSFQAYVSSLWKKRSPSVVETVVLRGRVSTLVLEMTFKTTEYHMFYIFIKCSKVVQGGYYVGHWVMYPCTRGRDFYEKGKLPCIMIWNAILAYSRRLCQDSVVHFPLTTLRVAKGWVLFFLFDKWYKFIPLSKKTYKVMG